MTLLFLNLIIWIAAMGTMREVQPVKLVSPPFAHGCGVRQDCDLNHPFGQTQITHGAKLPPPLVQAAVAMGRLGWTSTTPSTLTEEPAHSLVAPPSALAPLWTPGRWGGQRRLPLRQGGGLTWLSHDALPGAVMPEDHLHAEKKEFALLRGSSCGNRGGQ